MKRSIPALLLLLLLLLLLASCGGPGSPTAQAGRTNSSVITMAEIQETNVENVLDLVRSRRPAWLRTRGNQTMQNDAGIVVYLDQSRVGSVDAMRQIHPQDVASVSFLDAAAANYRFGQGHMHGAIVISLRREG